MAESQLALARISLEEGRTAEAASGAREAATEFHAENVPDMEAAAYVLLARSLLEQGNAEEAQKGVRSAAFTSAKSQQPMVRISVAITADRVRAGFYTRSSSAVQRVSQAIRDQQVLANTAEKVGFRELEFEARLAKAEATLDAGRTSDGVDQLSAIARDAQAKGFELIARKAVATRNRLSS
jgi:hypothetical protein